MIAAPALPRKGRGKSAASLALVNAAYTILEEIQPASVRAVCYKLFAQGVIANMSRAETNRVGAQLTWARETGVIPWEWICDETRAAETLLRPSTPANREDQTDAERVIRELLDDESAWPMAAVGDDSPEVPF